MEVVWTDEALADLEDILAYYHLEVGLRVAHAVHRRIVSEIEALPPYAERIRQSDRVPGMREGVVNKLPYVVFVTLLSDAVIVLNIVHTARKFPS